VYSNYTVVFATIRARTWRFWCGLRLFGKESRTGRVRAGLSRQKLGRFDCVQGVDLPSMDDNSGICPEYEFVGIPYIGWGCKSPFVVDVLDIDILLLVLYDGKLGATDFSNEHVNFLIDSSNP
jgi:hypothetical protein